MSALAHTKPPGPVVDILREYPVDQDCEGRPACRALHLSSRHKIQSSKKIPYHFNILSTAAAAFMQLEVLLSLCSLGWSRELHAAALADHVVDAAL